MNERMERGFKAYATRLALDVRAELGLEALEPLDPWLLADHLDIGIDTVSSFRDEAPHTRVLGGSERAAFSAVTVLDESVGKSSSTTSIPFPVRRTASRTSCRMGS